MLLYTILGRYFHGQFLALSNQKMQKRLHSIQLFVLWIDLVGLMDEMVLETGFNTLQD